MPFLVLGPLIKTKEYEKRYPYYKGATQEPRVFDIEARRNAILDGSWLLLYYSLLGFIGFSIGPSSLCVG